MTHTYLKSFFIATLAIPLLNFANEEEVVNHPIGGRKVTTQSTEKVESSSEFFFKSSPPVAYSPAVHNIQAIADFGDLITIEDGSQWVVNSQDTPKIASWNEKDSILITQNHRWFSKYQFRIVNQNSEMSVEANLHLGPIDDGKHAPSIISIDTTQGELVLSNGSRWQISQLDAIAFEDWRLNDLIIVGYNSGWDSGSLGLLINVDLNRCVRAQQF